MRDKLECLFAIHHLERLGLPQGIQKDHALQRHARESVLNLPLLIRLLISSSFSSPRPRRPAHSLSASSSSRACQRPPSSKTSPYLSFPFSCLSSSCPGSEPTSALRQTCQRWPCRAHRRPYRRGL